MAESVDAIIFIRTLSVKTVELKIIDYVFVSSSLTLSHQLL